MLHQPGIEPGSVQYDSTTRPPVLLVLAFIMTIYLRTGYPFSILPPCAENPRYRERERERRTGRRSLRGREMASFATLKLLIPHSHRFFRSSPLTRFKSLAIRDKKRLAFSAPCVIRWAQIWWTLSFVGIVHASVFNFQFLKLLLLFYP